MGFRFRKSLNILPGVRVNLSGSGASLSMGPRGASVSIGKQGVYGNIGIPGTGLSWRERLDKHSRRPAPPLTRKEPAPIPSQVVLKLIGNEARFFDGDDAPLDARLISKARAALGDRLPAFLEDQVTERNAAATALEQLHHDVPTKTGRVAASPSGKPSEHTYPDRESYMMALMTWRAAQANQGADQSELEDGILASLAALEWPYETNIDVSLTSGRLLLDVDLPEIEDMPTSLWSARPRSLTLVEVDLTKRQRADLYVRHVCALIVRLLGHAFAVDPAITRVAISAYTQRKASIGRIEDEYVATAELHRAEWEQVALANIAEIEPQNLLRRFGAKLDIDGRGHLLVQQPLS